MSNNEWPIGSVFDYTRSQYHCREGVAIVNDQGVLVDTYWRSLSDAHVLTPAEQQTAVMRFRMSDYDEIDEYRDHSGEWEQYASEDREAITSQHCLQTRWFIRKGASKHWPTRIANAQAEVAERQAKLESAQRQLQWARDDLAKVQADAWAESESA